MRAHPAGPRSGELHTDLPAPGAPADLNRLDPAVWPRGASRNEAGALSLAGVDVRDLAEQYQTPLMAIDEADFRSRCQDFANAFGGSTGVHYAGKAFLCTEIVHWLHDEGLALDVCTAGELRLALRAGFPARRIALHGSNKSAAELSMAVEAEIGAIVIDSFDEIARLAGLAEHRPAEEAIPVMVRVTVGVEAHTHEFIATAHEDQKFGFSLAGGDAAEAVRRIVALPGLRLIGLHSHIGSQIFDPSGFEVAAHRVVALLRQIVADHPQLAESIVALDLGGGLGIAYTATDDPPAPDQMAKSLLEIVTRECQIAGLAVPTVVVEPGRAMSARAGVTCYRVVSVKRQPGGRTFVAVDGGMGDNPRVAMYGARYSVAVANRHPLGPNQPVTVVGRYCEAGDAIAHDVPLPVDLHPGDLLAVACTGAYHHSMASTFNAVGRPPVVAVRDGRARILVRRETTADLLARDRG